MSDMLFREALAKKAVRRLQNEDDCDHFGTGSDSDRPDCLVNSNFCDGPVAVAPGSKVVAAVRASTFASLFSLSGSKGRPNHRLDKLKHIEHLDSTS